MVCRYVHTYAFLKGGESTTHSIFAKARPQHSHKHFVSCATNETLYHRRRGAAKAFIDSGKAWKWFLSKDPSGVGNGAAAKATASGAMVPARANPLAVSGAESTGAGEPVQVGQVAQMGPEEPSATVEGGVCSKTEVEVHWPKVL